MQLPTVHEWNLSLQRELPWASHAGVLIIGRRGAPFHGYMPIRSSGPILPFRPYHATKTSPKNVPSRGTGFRQEFGITPPLLGQLTAGGLSRLECGLTS